MSSKRMIGYDPLVRVSDDFGDNSLDPMWTPSNSGGSGTISETNERLEITWQSDIAATERWAYVSSSLLSSVLGTEITGYMQLPSEGTANHRTIDMFLIGDWSNYVQFQLQDNTGTYTRTLNKAVAGSGSTIKTETLAYNLTSYSPLVRIWIDATNIRVDLDGVQWQAATAHGLTFPQNQFYVFLLNRVSRTTAKTVIFDGFSIKYNPLIVS